MTTIRTRVTTTSGHVPSRSRPESEREGARADNAPPQTRGFQTIPSENVLSQLIERAVAAFKQGLVWDRGSIVNLEV
jgi:hypothetical protein